ncbi:MAG: hypothetical protein GQ549_03830 [Gammaproteobacteria bacterium]|nr:hypothetical protein [Gammaproteobacteria bacterium]
MRLVLVCLLWLGGLHATHAEVSISGVDAQIRNNILAYRFDIAVPLEKDAPDDFRVHITLGPDL